MLLKKITSLLIFLTVLGLSIYIYSPNIGGTYFYTLFVFSIAAFGISSLWSKYYTSLFLGLFLSLGLWLKFILRINANNLQKMDALGSFDFTPAAFDKFYLFSSAGLIGFTLASFLSSFYKTPIFEQKNTEILKKKYLKIKPILTFITFLLIAAVCFTNFYFKAYQRGTLSQVESSVVRGLYAWSLMFGLSSLITVIINLDTKLNIKPHYTVILLFIESTISSISMLSRGYVLNSGATLLAYSKYCAQNIKKNFFALSIVIVIFCIGLLLSTKIVSAVRVLDFEDRKTNYSLEQINSQIAGKSLVQTFDSLFVDRWVGLEGVLAATSFTGNRSAVFHEILVEKINSGTSTYDRKVANSVYAKDSTLGDKHQFVTIPGFIAWISLLDNLFYVFLACFIVLTICIYIEHFALKLTHNNFFVAIIGQVMAYRIVHSGYVPSQTYQIVLCILLTILGVKALDTILIRIIKKIPIT